MSISELARERKVSKQVISKNLRRWADAGRAVPTRKEGKSLLIKVAEYDAARGEVGDLARQMGEATKKSSIADDPTPQGQDGPLYTREQARAKQYEADLKEIELIRVRGELVEVAQLRDAATQAAEAMLRAIDQMASRSEDLAAATNVPVAQCRQFLKSVARDLRQRATDVFAGLASKAMASQDQPTEDDD